MLQAINQMKNGEEKGFNHVYDKTRKRVYEWAKLYIKDEEEARDLTQITYIEAYKNIHKLNTPEAIYGWLQTITRNQARKIIRKKQEEKTDLMSEDAEYVFENAETYDTESMPEISADQKATVEIVRGIIEELPELQRITVVFYYFEGLKVEQIAEEMDCSVNTVKSRLNYARKYIRERVEEKEQKEGYRLHVLGLPVLWYAIKSMSDSATITVQAAQEIYNGACAAVGLQATAISGSVAAADTATAAAGSTTTAAETAAGAAGGTSGAAVTTAAGAAAAAVGTGAAVASLSVTAKALMIAGAVAVAGLGTAGVVHLVNDAVENAMQEAGVEAETLAATEPAETKVQETVEATPTAETTQTEYELTAQAARQISAFVAAAYQCNYSSVNNGNGWNTFSMTPDECLMFVKDYIDMVNYSWGGGEHNAADLPYDWFHYNVTEQEVADFCKDGLGIGIPADYSYSFQNDGGSVQISGGKLASTFDARTIQVAGGDAQIVSQDQQSVVISGTCYWYDPEETAYQFTVTGIPSGNSDIFGGLTIQNIEISEGESTTQTSQAGRTLADIDLSGFIRMQSDNSYTEIAGGYFTHTDVPLYIRETPMKLLEGYWTLNGQELYFIGDDASDMVVQDLDGNPLDIHIGLYTMGELDTNAACMYVYTTATDFRDYPNYVYIK